MELALVVFGAPNRRWLWTPPQELTEAHPEIASSSNEPGASGNNDASGGGHGASLSAGGVIRGANIATPPSFVGHTKRVTLVEGSTS
jgi:hypothetical protein